MPLIDEKKALGMLRQGDKAAFSDIFSCYYKDLVLFASTFTKDRDLAEEIVQDVFLKLWETRQNLIITSSLKSFLLRSVQNKCIDWIRHLDIRLKHRESILDKPELLENDTENYLLYSELYTSLENALEQMPEEVSQAFQMNRFEGLTYQDIAEKYGVSVRTVEVRIGKALHLLKELLKDFILL
jgi:RNA polymerase sigma-70 factor (ECF subfamily)